MNSEKAPSASVSQDATQAEGDERTTPEASSADGPAADDASRSPEEESNSPIPGDPRALNEEQPLTKEQY